MKKKGEASLQNILLDSLLFQLLLLTSCLVFNLSLVKSGLGSDISLSFGAKWIQPFLN